MDNKVKKILIASAAICGLGLALYGAVKGYKNGKAIRVFVKNIDSLSDKIPVNVPEPVVALAMEKAAQKAAEKEAKEAIANVISEMSADIEENVGVIYQEALTKIDIDIDKVKDEVKKEAIEDVARQISKKIGNLWTVLGGNPPKSDATDYAEIINALSDAGIDDSYSVKEIIKAIKE